MGPMNKQMASNIDQSTNMASNKTEVNTPKYYTVQDTFPCGPANRN
eukprot:CAMPEP_0119341174 /NCGR_PEP_ID=MMETSP1333-20130426/101795_1 /TAXON_ID=418940 /ORGANISM="Scyphosphaera apsteinii, Strain RCC1455" /LENGTH=45 /DNA_ID= /DNA_START= /DNA_END= /DNA_ORIENTATION=